MVREVRAVRVVRVVRVVRAVRVVRVVRAVRGSGSYFFICKVGKSCVHSSIITNKNIKERQSCLCDGISSFTTLITMVHNTLI